jgi:hypothetical protein
MVVEKGMSILMGMRKGLVVHQSRTRVERSHVVMNCRNDDR